MTALNDIVSASFLALFTLSAAAGNVELSQRGAALAFDAAGCIVSLKGADARELVARPVPFAALTPTAGARAVDATAVERRPGNRLAFRFGTAGEAVLAVTPFEGGWTFRVVSVSPQEAQALTLGRLRPVCTTYRGTFANALSDEKSFAAVRGYEADSRMSIAGYCLSVAYSREHGIVGKRIGLAAGARTRAIPSLRAMTVAAGVPRSDLGGAWSLGAEGNRGSYIIENHSSRHDAQLVDLARRFGVSTVNLYSWWHRLGRYEINPRYFRGGWSDFTNSVAYLKREGLKVSLHTLTGCIDPADPWITPVPSDHLVVDAHYALAAPLAAEAKELVVAERPIDGHDLVYTYSCNGNILKVGKELIQYSGVRREKPYGFTGLKRGAFGTRAAAHPAGTSCDYLHQRYRALYPDPDGPLADAVANSIARAFNAVGADQIYFDGSEGMGRPYAVDAMRRKIFSALDRAQHPVLVEASCQGANNWWFHSRPGAWDSCNWAPKRFHDLHHARTTVQARKAEFLEPQFGWWWPKPVTAVSRGHFLDEDEYFASRNAGADVAMSVQGLDFVNGPVPFGQLALATVIGWYEHPRLAHAFRPDVAARFAQEGAEFRLRQGADGVWTVRDAAVRPHRAAGEASARWTERFAAAMPSALRVEALYGVEPYDSTNAVTALSAADLPEIRVTHAASVAANCRGTTDAAHGRALVLTAENRAATARGAWAGFCRPFAFPYHDFGSRAAFGVWVKGDGSGALLNLQIETPQEYHRSCSEHYAKLDFTGWKYLTFLLRERDAASYPRYVWPYANRLYPWIGRNPTDMRHVSSVNVWLNEVPPGKRVCVSVGEVRTMGTVERTVRDAAVTVNGRRCPLPFALASSEYAELERGVWTHYDRKGEPLARAPSEPELSVRAGENALDFASAAKEDRVEVTVTALGVPSPAFVSPLTAEMRRTMAWEYEMPVRYAPNAGLTAKGTVAVRPGEAAHVIARVLGDAKGARLVLTQGKVRHEVALPGESPLLRGAWRYEIAAPAAAQFRLELAKRYAK